MELKDQHKFVMEIGYVLINYVKTLILVSESNVIYVVNNNLIKIQILYKEAQNIFLKKKNY